MAQVYTDAEPVENLANSLIGTHHPELATAVIRYIFKEKASSKGGKVVLGSVKKLSDQQKFLIENHPDFLMEIPMDVWNDMDASKRTALVDHFLECCTRKGRAKLCPCLEVARKHRTARRQAYFL